MDGETFAHVWTLLVPSDSPAAVFVNGSILALFLIGCLDALAAIGRLARERRRVEEAREALQAPGSRPAALSADAIVGLLGVPAGSPVAQRIAQTLQLRTARIGGLQRTTSGHLDGYGLLARYIASILTLLGLLGTVLGLSFALFKIQGALMGVNEVEKLQELTAALGSTLRGMKTAFACTLAGLGSSLLLSSLNHLVRRFQVSLAERLDDFTFRALLPCLEREDPGADQAAKEFVQALRESARELEKVRESITAAASQYGTASQGFAGAVQELRGIVASFESGVSGLADDRQGFTQALVETRDAVRKLDEGIATHSERLSGLAGEHGAALRASSDLLVDLGLNLGALFEKQAAAEGAETQRRLLEALQGFPEHFRPMLAEHRGRLEAFVAGALEELKTSSSTLLSRLDQDHREKAAEQMRSHGKAYEEALRRSIRELERAAKQSEERLGSLFAAQADALRAVSDMVLDFHHNVTPLFEGAKGNGRPLPPSAPGR